MISSKEIKDVMKVFTKEDLLKLGDGDEGLVEYEYDEAFSKTYALA